MTYGLFVYNVNAEGFCRVKAPLSYKSLATKTRPWAKTSRAVRTDKNCAACGISVKGKQAWRPVESCAIDSMRVCLTCIETGLNRDNGHGGFIGGDTEVRGQS